VGPNSIFLAPATIVLKPSPAWRVDSGPSRSVAGTEPGWRKNKKKKFSLTRQDRVANPLIFIFLLKQYYFIFKKKWPGRPGNLKTRSWIGSATWSGFKTIPATHAYTSPYFINEGKVIKEEKERRNKVKSSSALLAHHVKRKIGI
jgi:hypothetical protein